jgi:tetratricopeptide (TPR) repeat protein
VGRIRASHGVCFSIICALLGVAFSQQPEVFESLLASAQQAQGRGDFEAAASYYRRAVSLRPEIAELQANLGLMYYQTGKDETAIAAFQKALRLKPDLFVPNLFLGLDYLRLKQLNQAILYLKRAALLKPSDPQVHLALGQAYAGTGRTRLAIASYLRIVQTDSNNADGWFHLGVAYLEQVEADARVLLSRHKDSGYLHALLAETFVEQHALIQAANSYKAALASKAFPSGTHADFGFVLLNQRDFQGAERELNAELASNPGSLMAKLGRARLRTEQGATAEATTEITEIWRTDPTFLRANAVVFQRGLPQPKVSELQHALAKSTAAGEIPQDVISLIMPDAAADTNREWRQPPPRILDSPKLSTDDAVSRAQKSRSNGAYRLCSDLLIPRLPQLPAKGLQLLASCAYATGNYEASYEAGQKLALTSTTEAEGLYWETRSAQKLATDTLAHASELDSNSPTLHVLLGDVYRQRNYYPDAEQEYRKALALQPEDRGALFGLSLSLLADSDIEGARRLAEATLKKNPEDPEFNAVMGEILSAQHDFAEAEPYLKKGLKTKPELVPHVHALLGRVYAESNRPQQAVAEMKLGLPDDKDGRLHFQIARLYLKLGDRESAKKAFEVSERLRTEGLTRAAVAMEQGQNNAEPQ